MPMVQLDSVPKDGFVPEKLLQAGWDGFRKRYTTGRHQRLLDKPAVYHQQKPPKDDLKASLDEL